MHGSASAYPPTREYSYLPLNVYFMWASPADDDVMQSAIIETADSLTHLTVSGGHLDVSIAPLYSNYALHGTSMSAMYGSSMDLLQTPKRRYDPANVMSLAGDWKIEMS